MNQRLYDGIIWMFAFAFLLFAFVLLVFEFRSQMAIAPVAAVFGASSCVLTAILLVNKTGADD